MKNGQHHNIVLTPVWGLCLFVLLYFLAALNYPGGSEVDKAARGFSWTHNYWCDLLEDKAENGYPNKAKPIAITAMAVLCISISLFWYFVPRLFDIPLWTKKLIRLTGFLSMGILVFLQAEQHDLIINTAVILGLLAMSFTLYGLFKSGKTKLLVMGIVCLILSLLNTYIYYSENRIDVLPVIQKISFFLFLLWFSLVSITLFKKLSFTR